MTHDPTPARRDPDDAAIAGMADVVTVRRNVTNWYQNATFVYPLLAAVVTGVAGLLLDSFELKGFSLFLFAVTVAMLPIVYMTWVATPTAVVFTRDAAVTLHRGREMKRIPWSRVRAVTMHDTLGNVRWKIVDDEGDHLTIDKDIEDPESLVEEARRLAGLAGGA
ncbi:MAG TPA: hypothetical protein VIO14_01085 [Dehalococcoidia bacterium]